MSTHYRDVETTVSVECCEHCHGDPWECPDKTSKNTPEMELEPIDTDTLILFVNGRLTRSDLVREILRRRPFEALTL